MSSHLLATANPEAVAQPDPDSLPNTTDWVIYVARPGEGRRGRHEFPALVLGRNDVRGRTGLDLIICYDANDVVFRDSVQMLDEYYDSSCWKLPPLKRDDELVQLREENAALRRAVFGDGGETAKPLVDCLVDFEKTIKGLQATVETLTTQARSTGKASKAK